MSNVLPFPIHEYRARPHQVGQSDRVRAGFKDVEYHDGAVIEHVRDGKPLTPKGRALLEDFSRRVS
jgi:hypothetical protein